MINFSFYLVMNRCFHTIGVNIGAYNWHYVSIVRLKQKYFMLNEKGAREKRTREAGSEDLSNTKLCTENPVSEKQKKIQ